jgi:hypothetical protein
LIVESIDTTQSISPAASAVASRRVVCEQHLVGEEPGVSLPRRLPRAELHWQVPPRDPGSVPVDDPLHHLPVITKPPTRLADVRGKQRSDLLPLSPDPPVVLGSV